MTQEEKELLLKDLSSRLPYGVICNVQDDKINKDYVLTDISAGGYGFNNNYGVFYGSESFVVKPYLRSMSSMVEEERKELYGLLLNIERLSFADILQRGVDTISPVYDWLNAHHFDYRGLIDKGLAIEAPEGMYN